MLGIFCSPILLRLLSILFPFYSSHDPRSLSPFATQLAQQFELIAVDFLPVLIAVIQPANRQSLFVIIIARQTQTH